ncbi:MAG: GGDEF domain-containing protein, partial [Polyangiaceae bacterium]
MNRALDQSEHVHDKVEQAAIDLSSVNAALKHEIAAGASLAKVERVLNKSEAIEVKVLEAAEELVTVNDALAEEIDERHHLERELSKVDAALVESRIEERHLRHESLHDALTTLPNFTLFKDRLRNALAQAQRHTRHLAVMFIDLNGFKAVNDTHGHELGDRVLKTVAERLQAIVRAGDTVSRRSGDEFLLLMLETKDEASVVAFAARLTARIAEPYEIDGSTISLTASLGIALYPEGGLTAEELLKHAD